MPSFFCQTIGPLSALQRWGGTSYTASMHLEKLVVRTSGSLLIGAFAGVGVWWFTGRRPWLFVAAGAFLASLLIACTPLLLLALSKLFWERRE
jgi:hypothetical protein